MNKSQANKLNQLQYLRNYHVRMADKLNRESTDLFNQANKHLAWANEILAWANEIDDIITSLESEVTCD
jgi:hypothetical protein